jgi:hypothetical protein
VKNDFGAFFQHLNLWEISEPEFGTREVSENAGGPPKFIFDGPDPVIEVGFFLGLPMRVVEATNVHTRLKQGFQSLAIVACWTDGRHDTGPSHALPPSLVVEADDKLVDVEIVDSFVADFHGPFPVAVRGFGVSKHVTREFEMDAVLFAIAVAVFSGLDVG